MLNIFLLAKEECGWDTFKSFFRYYLEELPKKLSPNTNENKYSTIVKVLSNSCNKNLVPFFKWWNWPILNDTITETQGLPEWKGIIETLNTADEVCNGGDSCCTDEKLCGEGEGDCDKDSHCKDGLRCGNNNCPQEEGTFQTTDDCCSADVLCDGGDSCCTADRPFGFGEGNCDKDADCKGDLK